MRWIEGSEIGGRKGDERSVRRWANEGKIGGRNGGSDVR